MQAIPSYYESREAIEKLNRDILELDPEKERIKVISIVALSCFAILVGCLKITTAPLFGLGLIVVGLVVGGRQFCKYREFREKYYKIARRADLFPKGDFTYVECSRINVLHLSSQQFNQIKKYLSKEDSITENSIPLLIRSQINYRITAGKIEDYSIQPLQIKLIKREDNAQAVLQTYQPWVDLLLIVEESDMPQKEKEQICEVIGRMIHKSKELENEIIETSLSLRKGKNPDFQIDFDDENQPYISVHYEDEINSYYTAQEFADFLQEEYNLDDK